MRLINKVLLVALFCGTILSAKDDKININFKDLKISELIRITSKIIDKNILMTSKIMVRLILYQINQ